MTSLEHHPGGAVTPELLAPAGDAECMRAAVSSGADAVYFGLTRYSARQRATNFALEELPETVAYLHAHNVRAYVALNTLVFSDELAEVSRIIAAIARAGADAVIVQDLGLVPLIRRMVASLPIHASTQMTVTDGRSVQWAARLGVERVILARELTLAEIARIRQATNVPLEVFVHGAMCISYGGQCLASEALWGRSANRGLCAQACRLPYRLLVDGRPRNLRGKPYLLSTKDLAAWDRVADLVQLGVAGLKIEGRLKAAHYVAITTRVYRAAIDAALAGRPFALPGDVRTALAQSYSRGFTHGFLDGVNHQDLVHGRSPKNRGVRVGVVAAVTGRGVIVAAENAGQRTAPHLRPGDGIVFDTGPAGVREQGGRVYAVKPSGRGRLLLEFGRGDLRPETIPAGAVVWRTDDPHLRRELEKSYARDRVVRPVPIAVRVRAAVGRPLEVRVTDDAGNTVEVTSPEPLQPARNRPLTEALLRKHFGRLGGTPLALASVELVGPANGPAQPVMVPMSVLNDLRRKAVDALLDARRLRSGPALVSPNALADIRREITERRAQEPPGRGAGPAPMLSVLVRTADQLAAVLQWHPQAASLRPAIIWSDPADPAGAAEAVSRCRSAEVRAGLATPRIIKPGNEAALDAMLGAQPDALLVRNLAALAYLTGGAFAGPLVGDFSLNASNEVAADVLLGAGLAVVTASLDLSLAQLAAMVSRLGPGRLEVIAHLHVPMMHMEHCVAAARLSAGRDGRSCGRPCRQRLAIRGRAGAEHPLVSDAMCRTTLFSGHVQSAICLLPRLQHLGLRRFRVDFLDEPPDAVGCILDLYAAVLEGALDADRAWSRLGPLCPGGLSRGTWDFD